MFMKKTLASIFIASVLAVSFGGAASAQVETIPSSFSTLPIIATTGTGVIDAIETLTNWLFVILSVTAVIFIVLAGMQFITAGGNPEAVGEARMKLMYAAVGIAVALLARAVPAVLSNFLGA